MKQREKPSQNCSFLKTELRKLVFQFLNVEFGSFALIKSDVMQLNTCVILVRVNVNSAAIACLGGMYEKLGRMVGRSYEETISLLVKALKNAEVDFDLVVRLFWLRE